MKNSLILEFRNKLLNNEITVSKNLENYLNKNDYESSLLDLSSFAIDKAKELDKVKITKETDLLFGTVSSIKDNINLKNNVTTFGSMYFKDFVSPFDATVVDNIKNKNSLIISKDVLDEFAQGGTGQHTEFNKALNPFNPNRITGGSSSGSATKVASNKVMFSIGSDTGDSVRTPASYLGIVGYKPSYGLISRYGVFPFAESFDTVGIFSRYVTDAAIVMSEIASHDEMDFSSSDKQENYFKNLKEPKKTKVLVYTYDLNTNEKIKKEYEDFLNFISKNENFEITYKEINKEIFEIIPHLYKAISYSEGSSNLNSLNGITVGNKVDYKNHVDLLKKLRTDYISKEVKKRMLIGNVATNENNFEEVYLKSKKIIEHINYEITNDLEKYDISISLASSIYAPEIKNFNVQNNSSNILQIANFLGLGSMVIPFIKHSNEDYVGLNIFAKQYDDQKIFDNALKLERIILEKKY